MNKITQQVLSAVAVYLLTVIMIMAFLLYVSGSVATDKGLFFHALRTYALPFGIPVALLSVPVNWVITKRQRNKGLMIVVIASALILLALVCFYFFWYLSVTSAIELLGADRDRFLFEGFKVKSAGYFIKFII